jgi:hypothetical protein
MLPSVHALGNGAGQPVSSCPERDIEGYHVPGMLCVIGPIATTCVMQTGNIVIMH